MVFDVLKNKISLRIEFQKIVFCFFLKEKIMFDLINKKLFYKTSKRNLYFFNPLNIVNITNF